MKKHTKQIVALLMVFAVVLVAGCTEKMTAEQIATRMKVQEENIKDFSATVVTTISVDGNNTTVRAKIMTKKPDKSRDEFIEPAMIAGKVIVKNGSTEWTYYPANNQATKRTLRKNEPSDTDYTRLIKGIMNETDISYEGIENVDGRSAYVILVTPHETDRDKSISRVRAWIDCKDWMPRRMEMYEGEDKHNIGVKIELDNMTFNTGIPDSEFIFKVPEGVQVISDDGVSDAAQPAPVSEAASLSVSAGPEINNLKYVSYRNLSISNAPALNQTARITFSIIPDRDIEILLIHVSFLDGFEFVDVEGDRLLTWGKDKTPYPNLERCARWCPTNLSKGEMYQFNATIKAVKTGNWTITGLDWENRVYISVSEDSAYISDEPFPKPIPMAGHSKYTDTRANMIRTSSKPSGYNLTPRPGNVSDAVHYDLWWDGTGWKWVKM
ncbi:MAG: outer membrane lipoprotein carrier protein LolA [Euryarchaeota archaeon]|nr:outer membrane lipoprotein carrier protein LolA [Euryarchaeota archaeon]